MNLVQKHALASVSPETASAAGVEHQLVLPQMGFGNPETKPGTVSVAESRDDSTDLVFWACGVKPPIEH